MSTLQQQFAQTAQPAAAPDRWLVSPLPPCAHTHACQSPEVLHADLKTFMACDGCAYVQPAPKHTLQRLAYLQQLQVDGWCHLSPQLLHDKVQAQGAIPLEGTAQVADVAGVDRCARSHALAVHLLEQGVDLVPVAAAAEVGEQDCVGDGVGLHSWGVGRAGRGAAGWMASVSVSTTGCCWLLCVCKWCCRHWQSVGPSILHAHTPVGWQCCAWHVLPGRSVRFGRSYCAAVPSLAFRA